MMPSATEVAREAWSGFWGGRRAPYHVEGAGPGYGAVLRDLIQPWSDLYSAWFDTLRQTAWPGAHGWDCRCPRCHPDDFRCRCCIGSADLLVRSRVGERRVVPIVIENTWRRERNVELKLSGWTPSDAKVKITGGILPPTKLSLAPCQEKTATLLIEVVADQQGSPPQAGEEAPPDVSNCVVLYADLRIIGCDVRPIRIAIAILPRECDTFRVDCRCVCC
jgi:hypothetical protein